MAQPGSWWRAILAQLKKGLKMKTINLPPYMPAVKAFMKRALKVGHIPLTPKQKRYFKLVVSGKAGARKKTVRNGFYNNGWQENPW